MASTVGQEGSVERLGSLMGLRELIDESRQLVSEARAELAALRQLREAIDKVGSLVVDMRTLSCASIVLPSTQIEIHLPGKLAQ